MTENYMSYPLGYKIQKVGRYIRLYGLARTIAKVRGQYHIQKVGSPLSTDWVRPGERRKDDSSVGIIGCGNFGFSNIAYYCNQLVPGSIRCAYDPVGERSVSLIKTYRGVYAAEDPQTILDDPAVETVFIASNHASHAEYAIRAIERDKVVHIEKPHVVSRDQLRRLMEACEAAKSARVFLGFNRPRSRHFRKLVQELDRQQGPLMINWFVAGHELDEGHWYFSPEEGGRILGNLCHWTDLTLRLVGNRSAFPIRVFGVRPESSQSDFAVSMVFADDSVCAISFSAKGHTFEGVREYLNVHKGNALAMLMDFHESVVDVGASKHRYRSVLRDHGHREAIRATMDGAFPESLEMIEDTANLFLGVREAVETGRTVTVHGATKAC